MFKWSEISICTLDTLRAIWGKWRKKLDFARTLTYGWIWEQHLISGRGGGSKTLREKNIDGDFRKTKGQWKTFFLDHEICSPYPFFQASSSIWNMNTILWHKWRNKWNKLYSERHHTLKRWYISYAIPKISLWWECSSTGCFSKFTTVTIIVQDPGVRGLHRISDVHLYYRSIIHVIQKELTLHQLYFLRPGARNIT